MSPRRGFEKFWGHFSHKTKREVNFNQEVCKMIDIHLKLQSNQFLSHKFKNKKICENYENLEKYSNFQNRFLPASIFKKTQLEGKVTPPTM